MSARYIGGLGIGLVLIALPLVALAADSGNQFPVVSGAPTSVTTGNPDCGSNGNGAFRLCNPLTAKSFCGLLSAIFNAILAFAIPVAMLFIVYSGFRFITARGRPEALQKAKMNFLYVVIGIALFLGAWFLSKVIANTIIALGGDSSLASCN